MAVYFYPVAAVGSLLVRKYGENEIDEKTREYLAKEINVEEATRVISENVGYYLPLVTFKTVCDIVVASFIGRNLYYMFKKLWEFLKPLFRAGLTNFINSIEKCGKCIQQTLKELFEKGMIFHAIHDKIKSNISLFGVLETLDYIHKAIVCAKTGLCHIIKFELTKYYLEIRGLIRALCEKLNISFLKYVPNVDEELSNEHHKNRNNKDEPLRYTYEISLEQLLHGTERQLEITREIREINQVPRKVRHVYTIKIEPGCKEEHIICLPEVGDKDPINIPANLLITIRSKPHILFKRQGTNLIYTKTISYANSRSSNQIEIPLLDGKTIFVNPGRPVDIDTELVVAGYGLPDPDQNGSRGRLLIRFNIQAPTNQINCDAIVTEKTHPESLIDQID